MNETKVRSAKPSDRAGDAGRFSVKNAEKTKGKVEATRQHHESTSRKAKPPEETVPLGLSFSEAGHSPDTPAASEATVPPILLEGDEPVSTGQIQTGPQKFAVAPGPAETRFEPSRTELPQAYGTGQLLLVARDPGVLYAHWDPTSKQIELSQQASVGSHLRLRIHADNLEGPVVTEVPVHAAARHWFVQVSGGATRYVAQYGYQPNGGRWHEIASSEPAASPKEITKPSEPVRFATLQFPVAEPPASSELGLLGAAASEVLSTRSASKPGAAPGALIPEFPLPPPLTRISAQAEPESMAEETALQQGPQPFKPSLPRQTPPTGPATALPLMPAAETEWSSAQERALAELINWSLIRHERVSSHEIAQVLSGEFERGRLFTVGEAPSNLAAAPQPALSSLGLGEVNAERRGFWFNVNAELVIYGATEPDAKVAFAGQVIRLRPDGTFSYRFALPDGSYHLSVSATSAQGDMRQAEFDFYRATRYTGQVGSGAETSELKPPVAPLGT